MKQVLQDLRTGSTYIESVPCPMLPNGHLLIRTIKTLVSVGTEKMLVDFGKASLIQKARQQPDKVRMVLDKIKTDGFLPTLEAVQAKLDQPIAMGYCNVGIVIECGGSVSGFAPGDRVVSNGNHAEMVVVPKNLCARIPANVSDDQASFTVLGAIALQGVRLVRPELGETIVVMGLGLVGLLTVQLLKASGCRVLAFDFNAQRVALAQQFGADAMVLKEGVDPVQFAHGCTDNGVTDSGVDGVLITASTASNDPVHQAAMMCRKRGRIVLVGVVGLSLSRADFYEKELTFQVSCSYGPGRYDPQYEQGGHDYPVGFVRWTEQRNFGAVLSAMASGSIDTVALLSRRYSLDQAEQAYTEITAGAALGVLLECDMQQDLQLLTSASVKSESTEAQSVPDERVNLAVLGAGNYASRVLIPAFAAASANLVTIACQNGASGVYAAKKFGFPSVTTQTDTLFTDPAISIVAIATRHNTHARFVCQALSAGKHTFVEKPLAITQSELLAVEQAYMQSRQLEHPPQLMIGFNRRFSSLITPVKTALGSARQPVCISMIINAGAINDNSWIQDKSVGGGRIIGEVCHFVDLALYLAGAEIVECSVVDVGVGGYSGISSDKCIIQIKFANGSIASIQYFANGHSGVAKERIEVFCGGSVYQIDNFRKLRCYGGSTRSRSLLRQDKGNAACVASFMKSVRAGGVAPIAFNDIQQVSRCVIDLAAMLE